ncbi:MGDG synthase family glycosyltransferase [Thermicanus aegyptius]|uniref:MGDG synthase family glycosyltransferase n=1 Tax=Thermicanus aegyptius TaxID=94009 RepID=UPI0004259FE1|nr:glycosyltransferase [Thermicanus aegyptius]
MNQGKKETILLLYSNYGDGHKHAAEAIREAFSLLHPEVEVILIDFMKYTHPLLHPISRRIFMQALKKFPFLYRYAYQKTRFSTSSNLLRFFTLLGFRRMLKLLKTTNPSAVVSTHPFAAAGMSRLKRYRFTQVPTVTVITDHTNHSYWIHPLTDAYLVGSSFAKKTLLGVGVKEEIITVTGIPIQPRFSNPYNPTELRKKYGLSSDLPTILIMGGGWGLIDEGEEVINRLDRFPRPIQIIFVCGHNRKLWRQLSRKSGRYRQRVMITEYINYVDELMAASDVIVTKPGGLTTSEAIALEVPMILYRPLPGQEEDNAQFLLDAGVAVMAATTSALAEQVNRLLDEPDLLQEMKAKERLLSLKGAAFSATEEILSTMRMKKSPSFQRPAPPVSVPSPLANPNSQDEENGELEDEMENVLTDSF